MQLEISRKYIYVVLVGIAVFVGAYLIFNKPADIINLPNEGTSIVAFGDSLVYGTGSSDGNDFVSLLSRRIGMPIVNLGVPGDTTRDGIARVDEIFDHNPKIVILLLGGNDFLKRIPMDETFRNLDSIVRKVQANGSAVLLLGIRGGLLYDSYDDDFDDFAESHGVGFVPNILDDLIGDTSLMSDAIHPNDAGYILVANKVEPVLREMLGVKWFFSNLYQDTAMFDTYRFSNL